MFCVSMRRGTESKTFKIQAKNHKEAWEWGKTQIKQFGPGWQLLSVEAAQAVIDGRKMELS